jgi:hypothetical protein
LIVSEDGLIDPDTSVGQTVTRAVFVVHAVLPLQVAFIL